MAWTQRTPNIARHYCPSWLGFTAISRAARRVGRLMKVCCFWQRPPLYASNIAIGRTPSSVTSSSQITIDIED